MKKAMLFGAIACVLGMLDADGMGLQQAKEEFQLTVARYGVVLSTIREYVRQLPGVTNVGTLQAYIAACIGEMEDFGEDAQDDIDSLTSLIGRLSVDLSDSVAATYRAAAAQDDNLEMAIVASRLEQERAEAAAAQEDEGYARAIAESEREAAAASAAIASELQKQAELAKQKAAQLLYTGKITEDSYDRLVYGFGATYPERWENAISLIDGEYNKHFPSESFDFGEVSRELLSKSDSDASDDEYSTGTSDSEKVVSRDSSPEPKEADAIPDEMQRRIGEFNEKKAEFGTNYVRYNDELSMGIWQRVNSFLGTTGQADLEVMKAEMRQIIADNGIPGDLDETLSAVQGDRAMITFQRLYTFAKEKGNLVNFVTTLLDGSSEERGTSRGKILYIFFSLF